jgi:uncharacterized protein (DUF697 family)
MLLEAIGLVDEQSTSRCQIEVFTDTSITPEFLAYAKEAFNPQTETLTVTATPYFDDIPSINERANLLVVLADDAPATGRVLIQALKKQVPAVVLTLDPVRLQQIARDHYNEIDAPSIVTVKEGLSEQKRFARLFASLGDWIVRELPDDQLTLARAYEFVRRPFVSNAIQATALQNAAIAAVFFLPGADMPLLTLNQAKLFLKIAAAYGAAIDSQRFGELGALLLGGFGFRALARRLVTGVVPVLGWAIRGGVGYTGTVAVGKIAQEYFEKGGDLKLIAERFKPKGEAEAEAGTGAEAAV